MYFYIDYLRWKLVDDDDVKSLKQDFITLLKLVREAAAKHPCPVQSQWNGMKLITWKLWSITFVREAKSSIMLGLHFHKFCFITLLLYYSLLQWYIMGVFSTYFLGLLLEDILFNDDATNEFRIIRVGCKLFHKIVLYITCWPSIIFPVIDMHSQLE